MGVFAGSTYLRRLIPLTDVNSSAICLVSTWFRFSAGEGGVIFSGGTGAASRIKLSLSTATGKLNFILANASGTTLWDVTSVSNYANGGYHHVAISVDLANARGQFYVDAAAASLTVNTALTSGTIDFAGSTEWTIATDQGVASTLVGAFYDLAFWPQLTLDLTSADSLRLLVADDNTVIPTQPAVLRMAGYGREGRDAGEPAALIFADRFQDNLGTGGRFTLTGAVNTDDLTTSPNPYRFVVRWPTPRVRWFLSEQSGIPYPKNMMVIEQRDGLTNFGKRIGYDEVDAMTHDERPGFTFVDAVLGVIDTEEDRDDILR